MVITRMLKRIKWTHEMLAEIDYLDLDVLEPDLSIGNGLVASAGNEDVLIVLTSSLKVSQFQVLFLIVFIRAELETKWLRSS